jgi:hypothetical protein
LRVAAQAVDEHVGAAVQALHRVGKAVVARDDHVLAAVLAREARLVFARHRADHRRAQAPRPRTDEQADAAGRGVHQHARAGLHVSKIVQQDVGGESLEKQRRGVVVFHRRRQAHDPIGRDAAHAAVSARNWAKVCHAVAGHDVGNTVTHVDHAVDG